MKAGIHNLVFDLDGTLVDSAPGIGAALAAAFLSAGKAAPASDVRRVIGPPIGIIARRLEPSLTDQEVSHIEQSYRQLYDSTGWQETPLFADVEQTLRGLRQQGFRLFVVTNKPKLPTGKILAHLAVADLFEMVLTRDSQTPGYSSKSAMLADLLDRAELSAEATLMVGDTAEDEEAALSNQAAFVHAAYGYGVPAHATTAIQAFPELAGLLLAHIQPEGAQVSA